MLMLINTTKKMKKTQHLQQVKKVNRLLTNLLKKHQKVNLLLQKSQLLSQKANYQQKDYLPKNQLSQ